MKAKIVGIIAVNHGASLRDYLKLEKEYLDSAIRAGYEEAEAWDRELDPLTNEALFVDCNIDDWATLTSKELRALLDEFKCNSWASVVLHKLAALKQEQESLDKEAKALRKARRERQQAKGLTHYPFAAIFGE